MENADANNAKNIENIKKSVINTAEPRLFELEAEVSKTAERIAEKLEQKAANLIVWEEELLVKEKELSLMQSKLSECDEKMKNLLEAERRIKTFEEILTQREVELESAAAKQEKVFKERSEALEANFKAKGKKEAEKQEEYEKRLSELLERENAVETAGQVLDSELSRKKSEAQSELLENKRKEMESLLSWITEEQAKWSQKLEEEYQKDANERKNLRENAIKELRDALDKEREERISELSERLKELEIQAEEKAAKRMEELNNKEEELSKKQEELATRENELEQNIRAVKREGRRQSVIENSLNEREESIDAEVELRFSGKLQQLKAEIEAKDKANGQLIGTIKNLEQEIETFRNIKERFGEDPVSSLLQRLATLEEENKKLNNRVLELPSVEDGQELEFVKGTLERLRAELYNVKLERDGMLSNDLRYKKLESEYNLIMTENSRLERQCEAGNREREYLQAQLNRLTQSTAQASEREERIKSIENSVAFNLKVPENTGETQEISELNWLNQIGQNCSDYGFKFPERLLYAFHTALKISDWSTLTVLAGVSGTGKSELPHLYAAFGGMNFIAVPVQPNWDSQESMLGFFNSIDNKFDAQPLLRFLAQASSKENGIDRSVNIVLLDEMNLAHVEHYFAEFLSKLELRRNAGEGEEPFVDINIGAGMEPYQLRLTRNVLWTGTMNQDETTKSLSDKVLDRGIVINFPRPKTLISRQKLMRLEDFVADRGITPLDYRVWSEKWIKRTLPFSPEQTVFINDNYRKLIEDINEQLAGAGRALGHRVWQSIEFYIANYPTVDEELKKSGGEVTEELKKAILVAAEDQLVQKCMPKLRGIEVRTHNKALQNIRTLLSDNGFNLDKDFQSASELGYGQFMWNSAEYIYNE